MDLDLIRGLIRVLNGATTLESIDFTNGESRVRVVKRGPHAVSTSAPCNRDAIVASPPSSETEGFLAFERPPLVSVTAGMTGTFYRSPSPNEQPFVSVGDLVEEGQTLAVIEAMKLLNSVDAPQAGRVAQIHTVDGATVSIDTVLFHIEPIVSDV